MKNYVVNYSSTKVDFNRRRTDLRIDIALQSRYVSLLEQTLFDCLHLKNRQIFS